MLLLNKADIKKVFTMKDAIEADKLAYKLLVEGKVDTPLRSSIQVPKNDACFLFMPAYAAETDTASVKIIGQFPNNLDKGLPSSPAQVLLMDGETGFISAILDGTYVTQVRTGAASGAAFDLLAKENCEIGALIGTGGQAACQLEAMLTARPMLKEVRVYSRNYDRVCKFVEEMQKEMAHFDAKIIPAKSSDEAIDNADLIITVTPATKPVFDGSKVKKGCTISCIGSYTYEMQELDPVALTRASKLYFDSESAVLSEAGDIRQPLDQGIITKDDFTGDLGMVVKGDLVGRENDEEIIIFESVGVGVQDLIAAKFIYDKALAAKAGTEWE